MFRHPNYYKNLRKLARNSELHVRPQGSEACDTDQAISSRKTVDVGDSVRPGPGLKLQAREDSTANSTRGQVAEPQASSVKHQAPEETSDKRQAPSNKHQA